MNEILQDQINDILVRLQYVIEMAEEYNLTNEQWFLDMEDTLNKYSVRDHNVNKNPLQDYVSKEE